MNDPRFYHLTSDPRFKVLCFCVDYGPGRVSHYDCVCVPVQRVPHHERKVKVDSRFQHMFSDKGFKVQCMGECFLVIILAAA